MGFWQRVLNVIKQADVIIFVLDARMPELSRNTEIEKHIEEAGKKCLYVFNKIDLVSRNALEKLRKKHKNAFFTKVKGKPNVGRLRTALQIEAKRADEKVSVGIVGYPNVGKSAITNALLRSGKTKVASFAGTTTGTQWATGKKFKMIDSPGVIPFEDDEVKLGILGAKNPEKLKHPEIVAMEIIKLFLDLDKKKLESHYGVNITETDEYEILLQIGKEKKLLQKGGVTDERRTSYMMIREWQTGKLRF